MTKHISDLPLTKLFGVGRILASNPANREVMLSMLRISSCVTQSSEPVSISYSWFSRVSSTRATGTQWYAEPQWWIPPTEVGGLFRSNLHTTDTGKSRNPTNGSWWIVQIRPFHKPIRLGL